MPKKRLIIIVVAASALWVLYRSDTSSTITPRQTSESRSTNRAPSTLISQTELRITESGTHLKGTVRSAEGSFAPAQISLYAQNAPKLGPLQSTLADEHGVFNLGKWPAAEYIVVAETTVGQSRANLRIDARDFEGPRYSDSPNPSAIELRLEACMSVHGQVLDSRELPIPGASVAIQHGYSRERIAEVMAGTEGEFSICRTVDDTLTAHAPGYADIRVSAWPGDTHYQWILQPRVAIAGRVVDSKGIALAGITVEIRDTSVSDPYMMSGNDGEFSFGTLPAGEYEIRASRSDEIRSSYSEAISTRNGKPLWWEIQMPDPESEEDWDEVEEDWDDEVEEDWGEPSLITGHVYFQGSPMAGAEVSTFPINGSCGLSRATTISAPDGRFQIRTKEPGAVTISVEHSKGTASAITTESDTSPIAIDFELIAAASLSGRIHDRNGDPLPRTSLCLRGSGRDGTTDVNGRFHIRQLQPGSWDLDVGCHGKLSADLEEVTITSGQSMEIELTTQLLAGQSIRGNIVRDDDGPLLGMACIDYAETCTVLGPGGSFVFGSLSNPGPYRIDVSAIDGAVASADVQLDTPRVILVGKAGAVNGIAPKGCSVSAGIPSSSTGRNFHIGPTGPGPVRAKLECDDGTHKTLTFTIVAGKTISLGPIRP